MLCLFYILIFFLTTTTLSQHFPPPSRSPPKPKPPSTPPPTTWTSLILTHHGERLPPLTNPHPTLTAQGATQLFSAGSLIRSRYLTGPGSSPQTAFVPLQGLQRDYLDSQRVEVLAGPEQYTVASAWAFLQGLYPPGKGGGEAPLGGYQYGRVETAGAADWNSVWIAGNERCPYHALSTANQMNTTTYLNTTLTSAPFYASTTPTLFRGLIPDAMVSYRHAAELYEYAAYAKQHNDTVASKLPTSVLKRLRVLAAKWMWGVYGARGTGAEAGEEEDHEWFGLMKPIAGRTFAERVLYLLNRTTTGRPGALNLLFSSSAAPFVGFSAISGLAEHDARFKGWVEPGSMMVFEVFSYTDPAGGVPGKEDLWVRFLYRNGTTAGSALVGFPLFGRGRGGMDMRFEEFERKMGEVGMGVGLWCEACGGGPVFCPAFVEGVEKGRKDAEEKERGKNGGGGEKGGKEKKKKKKKKKATALELGLGLGLTGLVVLGGILTVFFCARAQRKKVEGYGDKDRERTGEEGPGSWEMGVRTPKGEEERVKSTSDYPVQNEETVRSTSNYSVQNEDDEAINPLREPVRVEDRV